MGKFIQFTVKCRRCGIDHVFNVKEDSYKAYMNGACVQDAFPELSPEYREILISGLCDNCFDRIFQDY